MKSNLYTYLCQAMDFPILTSGYLGVTYWWIYGCLL